MQINLTGRHVEITSALHNYVQTKFEKIERRLVNMVNIHVILSVEKQSKKAEASLYTNGHNIFADAEDDDMYVAIDSLTDKLDRQILKIKEKVQRHR